MFLDNRSNLLVVGCGGNGLSLLLGCVGVQRSGTGLSAADVCSVTGSLETVSEGGTASNADASAGEAA